MTEIRPCAESDLAMLNESWPSSTSVHDAHFQSQADGRITFLVAWRQTEALGSVVVRWDGFPDVNARRAYPGCAEICHLQVREESRGTGVGTALVAAAEQIARQGAGIATRRAHAMWRPVGQDGLGTDVSPPRSGVSMSSPDSTTPQVLVRIDRDR